MNDYLAQDKGLGVMKATLVQVGVGTNPGSYLINKLGLLGPCLFTLSRYDPPAVSHSGPVCLSPAHLLTLAPSHLLTRRCLALGH